MSVTYPKLKTLHCETLDAADAGRMFSVLEELHVAEVRNATGKQSVIPSLKNLLLYGNLTASQEPPHDFVVLNAGSLVSLKWGEFPFEIEDMNFHKLTDLTAGSLPDKNVTFPSIKYLTLGSFDYGYVLSSLPLQQLEKLTPRFTGSSRCGKVLLTNRNRDEERILLIVRIKRKGQNW